jgi:hypothetical protein
VENDGGVCDKGRLYRPDLLLVGGTVRVSGD